MNFIRSSIERMEGIASHGFPKPPSVLPNVHHAFAALASGVDAAEDQEKLIPFLRRCQMLGVERLRRGDLNRVLRGAWCDSEFDQLGSDALRRAVADDRSSTTKAMIDGYLLYFPFEREIMPALAAACRNLAERHEGHWRKRSQTYQLFDPALAPLILGKKMANGEGNSFIDVMADAGLGLSPFATKLGTHAFSAACRAIATTRGDAAIDVQAHLLALLESEDQFDDAPNIVRALLEPWIADSPSPTHRQAITAFLLDRIADPRIYPKKQKWDPIRSHLIEDVGQERAEEIIGVLRRWLTDVAMRTFFRAIAETTDRPDQWKQRQDFWLAYLDAGYVKDAWPALGRRAQNEIRDTARALGERLDYGVTQNGPVSSSSLILEIGDLRIAEWSDNGMCRFWNTQNAKAPPLYHKRYDNTLLRTTTGASDFEALRHDAGGMWVYRFASLIYRRTGIEHPKHGRGFG